jgi:hypothetical protein
MNKEHRGRGRPVKYVKYLLHRLELEPQILKGIKISGYLEGIEASKSIPDVIEYVGCRYGGGSYQLRLDDGTGNYVVSHRFEIAGLPMAICKCITLDLLRNGCRCGGS